MRKKGEHIFFMIAWIFTGIFFACLFPLFAQAEESYDYSDAQRIMGEAMGEEAPDLSGLVEKITSGNALEALKEIPSWLKKSLLSEISVNKKNLGHILFIAAFGTFFSGLAASFKDRQAGETGFYVTYLLLFSLLLTGFYEAAQVASRAVDKVLSFTGALLPAFTLAVASAGKTMTSVFTYEFIIGAISVTQWLFQKIFIPGISVYVVLTLVNHISREEILTKMTEFLELMLEWGLKTVLGIVIGYGALQSLILPLADSVKTGTLSKALSMIPGIGSGAEAAASLVTGTASLIKNGIGAAALAGLVLICAVPVLKLLLIMVLYYGAAAMVQPIADERVTECLSGAAAGLRLLLKVTTASAGMFLLLIGVLCAFTSVQI